MLDVGDKAPDFRLTGIDENGNDIECTLTDLLSKGRDLILYFYPKDDTPGCTTEACDFRDNLNRIVPLATVVGVSADTLQNHRKFREKYSLTFPLLSDMDKKVMEAYGAYGEKTMYGKKSMGVIRSTYLISTDGVVKKRWLNVKAKGHVEKILLVL